jgi:hypothetical protein
MLFNIDGSIVGRGFVAVAGFDGWVELAGVEVACCRLLPVALEFTARVD